MVNIMQIRKLRNYKNKKYRYSKELNNSFCKKKIV